MTHRSIKVRRATRGGFTLIETAIVTAIVGIAIVSMMQLFAAGSMANADSAELTTAVYLANNIDEMLQGASYTTLKATYDNQIYGPPVNASGTSLSNFNGWKQTVSVKYVDPNLLTSVVPDTQIEPTSQVTVTISHNNNPIYVAKWNVVQPQ